MRHKAPNCPFCREPIDFGKTAVNQQLFDKLERNIEVPHDYDRDAIPANMRVEDILPPYQPLAQHEDNQRGLHDRGEVRRYGEYEQIMERRRGGRENE